MQIKFLYLALEGKDYDIENPCLVSDFDFQTGFMFDYFEKSLKANKFIADDFQFITIRGRKNPSKSVVLKEHFKSLEIEILFDEEKYFQLYPYENKYPLEGLLKPVLKEKEFNNFLFKMVMEGLEKGKEQKAPIPFDFLINACLDFKLNGFKNEWLYKTKAFKEYGIKASLFCKLTCNYFSLELMIEENKKEVFRKEILKTLPSNLIYKPLFKDIIIEKGELIITSADLENPILYKMLLSKILSVNKK